MCPHLQLQKYNVLCNVAVNQDMPSPPFSCKCIVFPSCTEHMDYMTCVVTDFILDCWNTTWPIEDCCVCHVVCGHFNTNTGNVKHVSIISTKIIKVVRKLQFSLFVFPQVASVQGNPLIILCVNVSYIWCLHQKKIFQPKTESSSWHIRYLWKLCEL